MSKSENIMNKSYFDISEEIQIALKRHRPIVALESTLISHGLPYPENVNVAKSSMNAVKENGSVPATIAIINGKIKVGLNDEDVMTTFQSRFGSQEWLQPYTDETLKKLPDQGIKDIHILSPGFSSDCLETLEELNVENRDYFMEAGGLKYHYIDCLNDSEDHIRIISELIKKHTIPCTTANKLIFNLV